MGRTTKAALPEMLTEVLNAGTNLLAANTPANQIREH